MSSTQERQTHKQHPHSEYLSAYVDHRLDVARMRQIGVHLGGCAKCSQQVVQFEGLRARLRGLPVPPPEPQFWASAYRRLRVEQHARPARPFWRGLPAAPAGRWAAGVAAAAVAVSLAFSPLTRTPTMQPVPATTAAPVVQDVSPDVAALVASHTDSVSRLPLADVDRQKMIAADVHQDADLPDPADSADGSF